MFDWKHGTRSAADAKAGEKRSSAGALLGVATVLAILGTVGYVVFVRPKVDRRQLVGQSGQPRGSLVIGSVVAVFDAVSIDREDRRDRNDPSRNYTVSATRVTTLDAGSGARIAQELIHGGGGGCAVATPARVWCDLVDGELALYDARTFQRLHTLGELVAAAQLGTLVPGRWHLAGARAYQLLDDGRVAVVDGAAGTPSARREDEVPPPLRDQGPLGVAPAKAAIAMVGDCGAHEARAADLQRPAGAARRTIDRGQGPRARVLQGKVPSKETYLAPVWIEGDAPLLLHHTSLTPEDDKVQVSRLSPAGDAVWTREVGRGCEQVAAHGNVVVVTTRDPARRVVGVDSETGAVTYSVGF